LYADLCRRLANDPRVGAIADDLSWDVPLRLLGGLHYLVLASLASWDEIDDALDGQAEFLARWMTEQDVQTNEVQRSWGLVPAFLSVSDGRPFDLLELGPSAGLNLLWDRYRYRYSSGTWGEGTFELTGDDRVPPPAELFERHVSVGRRRGVDLNPIDVTTDHGALLLQAFVWPDQPGRADRLRRAIDVVRADPPELLQGDYVELLPALLADRREGEQLLVFQSASTQYLDVAGLERVRSSLREAASDAPLVFVSTANAPEHNGYALEVEHHPQGRVTRLGVLDFHGEWLEWAK
jgi:hypothetical protein